MCGSAAAQTRIGPKTFVSNWARASGIEVSSTAPAMPKAGVVHDDVEAAGGAHDVLDAPRHLLVARDVHADGLERLAGVGARGAARAVDAVPERREVPRALEADAGRRAGDQHDTGRAAARFGSHLVKSLALGNGCLAEPAQRALASSISTRRWSSRSSCWRPRSY
jgi:hypothetical protein